MYERDTVLAADLENFSCFCLGELGHLKDVLQGITLTHRAIEEQQKKGEMKMRHVHLGVGFTYIPLIPSVLQFSLQHPSFFFCIIIYKM